MSAAAAAAAGPPAAAAPPAADVAAAPAPIPPDLAPPTPLVSPGTTIYIKTGGAGELLSNGSMSLPPTTIDDVIGEVVRKAGSGPQF